MSFRHILIQKSDFSLSEEEARMQRECPGFGALCTFTGYVRDYSESDSIRALELEHYPGMTENVLNDLISEAETRWPVQGASVIHRVGQLDASDRIVLVMVASAHRQAAFEACAFLMDYLKTRAPFWKRELGSRSSQWVEAKDSDFDQANRW